METFQRKLFFTIFALVLVCTNSFAGKSYQNVNRKIRVGLASCGKKKSFQIHPSNGFIEIFDNTSKQAIYSGKAERVVVYYVKKGTLKVVVDGKKNFLNIKAELLFSPIGKPPNFMQIKASGRKKRSYRGSIAIYPDGNKLFAVNQVDLEEYLKSVVPSEIFNRAPAPAMEAQAIAARTYAIRNIDRHRKKNPYDLCDTVHCQAYTGMVKEIKATSLAVSSTYGKILTFEDKPANTVYHSNCGGVLLSSKAAWGGKPMPYLVCHRDGLKGEQLFCSMGAKLKKKSAKLKLPKPVKRLIVRSLPEKTRMKYHNNFGHRVGMCQDGTIGMAAVGYSYKQILGFYYPGTRLVTLNYARPKSPAKPRKRIVKPKPIVLAMKPAGISNLKQPSEQIFQANPTQLSFIRANKRRGNQTKNSVLNTLKEVSEPQEKGKPLFRKVFWNPAQPDISKDTSTNE